MKIQSVLVFIWLFVLLVEGSHNRGGFITWTCNGKTVTFTFTHAWRSGAADSIGVNFGDGTSATYGPTNMVFSGTDSAGSGYQVYTNTATHTYSGNGPYTVYWENCCRVGTLQNAANGNFKVRTVVDLSSGVGSPTSSLPPLLQFPISSSASYQIGVADAAGLGYSCRMATSAESDISSIASIGSNAISVSSSCLLSWNSAAGQSGNIYAVSIVVAQATTQTVIPLDFIVQLVVQASLPTCSVASYNAVATVGQPWSVTIVGTSNSASSLTVTALGLASDATLSPTSGAVPLTVTLSTTPVKAGAYSTSIVYTDSNHRSATCSVAYQVAAAPSCSLQYTACSVSNGVTTYSLTSSSADSYSWSSACSGSFDSTTSGSVKFTTTTNPNTACSFSASVTTSGVTSSCSVSASCPLCTGAPAPTCAVDKPATVQVYDPQSVEKYVNGDILAVLSDPDGAIVSAVSNNLPAGVGLTAGGKFYVTSQPDLDSGTFPITVTTTDVYGGVTTLTFNLVLLDITCGQGLSSCGQACYTVGVQDCLTYNGKRHICPHNNLICNMVDQCCYDPSTQTCINGKLCPLGYQKCNDDCYDPSTRSCLTSSSGKQLCPVGNQLCGSNCYDPTQFWCTAGTMCRSNEQSCNGVCYDPNASDCVSNTLIGKGNLYCGPGVYNPNAYDCLNGHDLCPKGMKSCAGACYNPASYVCSPSFQMCPTSAPEQCGTACYDDNIYTCCDPANNRVCQI